MNTTENNELKISHKAEPLQDITYPEDLKSSIKQVTKLVDENSQSNWHIELALKISELTEDFEDFRNPDKDFRDSQFCRHFLWNVEDYGTQIRRAARHDELWRVELVGMQVFKFASGIAVTNENYQDKVITTFTNIVTGIILSYIGYQNNKGIEECISELKAAIQIVRTSPQKLIVM